MKPLRGNYISIDWDGSDKDAKRFLGRSANLKVCHVCALGCMMLAWVRRFDKLTVGELDDYDRYDIGEDMKKAFEPRQLRLIESAFEMKTIFYSEDEITAQIAVNFGLRWEDDRDRLRAIMQNIVENEGEFVPPQPEEGKSP